MNTKYPHLEPQAKECIDGCSEVENAQIMMTSEGFQTDAEALILRDFLGYARDKGVTVVILPGNQETDMPEDALVTVKENF